MQYHPEASAGPHDSNYLFGRFRELLAVPRVVSTAAGNAELGRHAAEDSFQPSKSTQITSMAAIASRGLLISSATSNPATR